MCFWKDRLSKLLKQRQEDHCIASILKVCSAMSVVTLPEHILSKDLGGVAQGSQDVTGVGDDSLKFQSCWTAFSFEPLCEHLLKRGIVSLFP